jgi:hypothetical protein
MQESCCCCAWYQVLRDGGLCHPNCLASNCWQWLEDLQVDELVIGIQKLAIERTCKVACVVDRHMTSSAAAV